jgi:hypothetical protein
VGAVDERVGGGGAGEEEVGFDPLALAVDVGVDAVSPLGVGSRFGDVDVVGSGSDPDVAALPGGGLLPDADVMALGEGVEGFLEDDVGRSAVDGEQGDGACE